MNCHGVEGVTSGTWNRWSHCVYIREAEKAERECSLLAFFFPSPGLSQWNVVKSTFSMGLPTSVTLLWKPTQTNLIHRWLSNAVKMTIKINHHCVCLEGLPQKAVSRKNGFGIRKSGFMLKHAIWLKCPPSVKWRHGTRPISSPHLWNKVPLQFLVGCIKLLNLNLWGDRFYSFFHYPKFFIVESFFHLLGQVTLGLFFWKLFWKGFLFLGFFLGKFLLVYRKTTDVWYFLLRGDFSD